MQPQWIGPLAPRLTVRVDETRIPGVKGGCPLIAEVDGRRWRLAAGSNPLPVPPGVRTLRVWCSYYGIEVGGAELTVDTSAPYPLLVHYAPPLTIYNRGALALHPVPRPGRAALLGIMAGAPALVLLVVVVLVAVRQLTG
ncbi:hypothetical protein [Nocardiopsis composta]|uniref:Uncharacterized protein n=1 Tax=Nocardiopsis composta TaxID=157465 RepID=A0A7W8VBS9_9ACTN|nr:hypothetical protein [Nocardiopsis composta]MBB5430223.1 hypothetical protein [Nocardiopsis composta]